MKVIPLTLAPDVPVYFDAQPEEARAHTAYLAMNSAAVLAAFATIKATGGAAHLWSGRFWGKPSVLRQL